MIVVFPKVSDNIILFYVHSFRNVAPRSMITNNTHIYTSKIFRYKKST